MKSAEIRKLFLEYFEKKGHRVFPGISLVPPDPSILFTTAGMVQFKNNFLGKSKDGYSRAASSQRCLRTSDVDSVGKTPRHLTFFEMLGNFSFGDYFKKDAIQWGWEFLTREAGLPEAKLHASVYEDDDEAYNLWKEIIPEKRIVKLGKADNFWEMGETGPCGPCSEIYMDLGKKMGCGKKNCAPGCDCDRWIEIWNLVFTQYDRDINGKLQPLPQKNIDTGMGLERLTAVINGLDSNFDTDLLKPIIEFICSSTGIKYGSNSAKDTALRIMADHSRAITFLIADGVIPSNEGRGYVLRRIIRRAIRQASILDIEVPFLYTIVDEVIRVMKEPYPELEKYREHIVTVTKSEEISFKQTLDSGMQRLNELISAKKDKVIKGKEAFILYDTYGFPLELTGEIAAEKGFKVDEKGFEKEMKKQRERAKAAWSGSGEADTEVYGEIIRESGTNEFKGYDSVETSSKVISLMKKVKKAGKNALSSADNAGKGDEVEIVLDKTPFYGESGGQLGDKGVITGAKDTEVLITETKKPLEGLIVHIGKVNKGRINRGDRVSASIDIENRNDIRRNHTATHILQAVLREVLGTHVQQSGSLVSNNRLRFDFTHPKPLTIDELSEIQKKVYDAIIADKPVVSSDTTLSKAKSMGAMALFGEKYGDKVRAVRIGSDEKNHFSLELCGGTHCGSTGEIGIFKIISESGIAAGIRRIEALTGRDAYERMIEQRDRLISSLSELLKSAPVEMVDKVENLIKQNKELTKQLQNVKNVSMKSDSDDLMNKVQTIDGIKVIASALEEIDAKTLRSFGDRLKDKLKSGIVVLGSVAGNKPSLIVMVTPDLVKKGYNAGNIIKKLSAIIDGSGGGRPDMAQAGGKSPGKLQDAILGVEKAIKQE